MSFSRGACVSISLAHAEEPAPRATPDAAPPQATTAAQGVVVVALSGATDAAWPIARALYGKHGLLPPGLTDAEARALAGESPPAPPAATPATAASTAPPAMSADAPRGPAPTDRVAEITRLRAEIERPATRHAALADLVALTRARGALIVGAAAGVTVTRLYVAETKLIGDAITAPSDSVDIDKIAADAGAKTKPKTASTSLLRSPWTWVAVGAAAVLGTVIYLVSKGESKSADGVPLRLSTDR